MGAEEKPDEVLTFGRVRINPLIAYIAAGVLSGTGLNVGYDSFRGTTDHRPHPYTSIMGDADRTAHIERLKTETESRRTADIELSKDVLRIEAAMEQCRVRLNNGQSREHATIKAIQFRLERLEDE